MDAQLRQRLIGAAVLIALAVIFLPMLLSGPRPVSNEEVSLVIPPPGASPANAGERTVTLPADRVTTLPEPDADAVALVDTATAPPATLPSDPPPPVAPVVRETSPVAVKPAPPAAVNTRPTATATSAASGAPRFDPATAASGPFFLQLGSYGQAERAEALVGQLSALGISARQEPFKSGGKTLYRVRSAGYPSRTAAETARLKAVSGISGLSASVAEAALPSATAPTRAPAAVVAGFAVQVGVFSVQAKANELSEQLKRAGFAAFVERVQASNGPAHRVRVGPIARKPDAETMRDQIKAKLGVSGLVVPHP
jgi:cell division septation protein DedD